MEEGAACRIFRRWFDEVWTGKREGAMDELLARDAVVHAADDEGRDVVGPEGFRPFYRKFREAFPDIRFEIHELIGDDRIAAGRWTAHMTHRGEGLGVKPTGNEVRVTGMSFARVDGGKIVEGWNEWDRMKLASAIGLIKSG